jgi:transposase
MIRGERSMMGRREGGQGQFFYAFDLAQVVPADHLVRQIDGVLDLDWVHKELAPYYSHTGRPSIDPVLMIRMLIVGYVFAIRSERLLCSEVQVNRRRPVKAVARILRRNRSVTGALCAQCCGRDT